MFQSKHVTYHSIRCCFGFLAGDSVGLVLRSEGWSALVAVFLCVCVSECVNLNLNLVYFILFVFLFFCFFCFFVFLFRLF